MSVGEKLAVAENLLREFKAELGKKDASKNLGRRLAVVKSLLGECKAAEGTSKDLGEILRKQVKFGVPVGYMNRVAHVEQTDVFLNALEAVIPSCLCLGEVVSYLGREAICFKEPILGTARKRFDCFKKWLDDQSKNNDQSMGSVSTGKALAKIFAYYIFAILVVRPTGISDHTESDDTSFEELWRVARTDFPLKILRNWMDVNLIATAIAQLEEAKVGIKKWEPLSYAYCRIYCSSAEERRAIYDRAIEECTKCGLLGTEAIWFFISKATKEAISS